MSNASEDEYRWPGQKTLEIPFEDIRLVYRVGDRDVIVDQMEILESEWDEETEMEVPRVRVIPTTNIELLPENANQTQKPNENGKKELSDLDAADGTSSDTFAPAVHSTTFEPSLFTPPFHSTIIDELRGKYSKFRVRHSEEFVEKMLSLDKREETKKQSVKLMRSPIKELYYKQKKQASEVAKQQQLTDESLSIIGRYMQKNLRNGSTSA
jgi:large subunit ribosomal protein L24